MNTERLFLRKLNEEDYKTLYPLHSDPEVMKYIRAPDKSIDQTQNRLNEILDYSKENPHYSLYLAFTKGDDELIGWALFLHGEMNLNNEIEVGYRLFKKYWGQGYATELTKRMIKFGFDELKLKRICAVTDPLHKKSKNVLIKSGLKYIDERMYYGHMCSYFEVKND